jgi:hypothetical protein
MSVLHQAVASDTGQVYIWLADAFDNGAGYRGTGSPTSLIVISGMGPGAPGRDGSGIVSYPDLASLRAASPPADGTIAKVIIPTREFRYS